MTTPHEGRPVVPIGRVAKAHGIKGELAIEVTSDLPDRFVPDAAIQIAGVWHTIRTTRPHQGRMLVTLDGVTDRTAAELLRGNVVFGEERADEPGEFYLVQDLLGCVVVDDNGQSLGRVVDIVGMPAAAPYDLLEIAKADGSVWLLPAVDDYVTVDDDGNERIIRLVNPPQGLTDGTES